jgi:hypothetical protein
MSYRPTIGGRLRKRTSGVDRLQAALFFGALTSSRRLVRPVIGRHHEAHSDLE